MTELAVPVPQRIPRYLSDYGVYGAVAVLLLVNALFTDNFLAVGNLRTQLVQVSPVVIVALGMALVIGTEGIDLSVGSVMALAAAVLPLYLGYGVLPAVLLALAAGIAVGALNGALVAVVRVQPIVAPLALFVGGRGLALVLAHEGRGRRDDGLQPHDGDELIVGVYAPVDAAGQPVGKQRLNPSGIWYTASSGIWQSVWLE